MTIKIAHICAVTASVKFLLADQLRYLEGLGYEMHAISSPGPYLDDLRRLGLRWHPARISRAITPAEDLKGVMDLVALYRRHRFDIIHTHTPKGILMGQLAARIARVPVVIQTLHGFYHAGVAPGPRREVIRLLELLTCADADHVLSQNIEDVELIHGLPGWRERVSISCLGNGIDIDRFQPHQDGLEERRRKRQAVGLDPDALVVGIVGRYVAEKGYRELVEAVKRLVPRYPRLQVLTIGTNPAIERDHERLDPQADPEVGDRFVCLYDRSDMEELYRLMDVFTLPSYREGFPRSCMEASATGLAVVTTDVRGCRQAVEDGDNGLIVPARDGEALARGLERLLEDPARREAMGRRGRLKAEEEFDQRRVFKVVADCYERLQGQRRG